MTVEQLTEKYMNLPVDIERIELNIDDKQKALIDNMIDMSTKEEFDIEMVLSLSLPPVSVYALLKSVYSDKMSSGFVNIIADRMNVKELEEKMSAREIVSASKGDRKCIPVTKDEAEEFQHQVIIPIITQGDIIGAVVLLSLEAMDPMDEVEMKLAQSAADFLGKQMEQ